jgi:hypothetical protein
MEMTNELRKIVEIQQKQLKQNDFRSFFKYCSDTIIHPIFEEQQLRCTQPRSLNDPIEFNPSFKFNMGWKAYQQYELNGNIFPSIESFYRMQMIESQINHYGILSFTKNPLSFDMWSQYANGHKGFVLEFKDKFWEKPYMKSNSEEFNEFNPVQYIDDYFVNLDQLASNKNYITAKDMLRELFFKKTSRWSHEGEYRLVRPLTDCSNYVLPVPERTHPFTDLGIYTFRFEWDCIESVILGTSMSEANKSLISGICQAHGIPLHQAYIFRDIKDWQDKPCAMSYLPFSEASEQEKFTNVKPQLLCTDTISLGGKGTIKKINNIEELPYFKGYENLVGSFIDIRNKKNISNN